MSLSALSLGFSFPGAFYLSIPIIGVLIYAYLRKKKLQPVTIPSLFLLKDITTIVSKRHRFVPPPRFWLELLLLGLLLLCLAGFFHKSEDSRYAIVLDNSLSTAAQVKGTNILELSKLELRNRLAVLPGQALFDLYRTSPRLERVGGAQLSFSALTGILDQIKPAFAAENFDTLIPQVIQREQYQGLLIFTDQKLAFPEVAGEFQRFASAHAVLGENGSTLENITISNIVADVSEDQLLVSVSAYTQSPVEVLLHFEGFDHTRSSWSNIASEKLSLKASETKEQQFALPDSKYDSWRIRIDSESVAAGKNSLLEDDSAYVLTQVVGSLVYVISPRSLAELGIAKVRGVDFKIVAIDEYQATLTKPERAVYLFVDYVPNGLPDRDSLVIAPPNGTSGFRTGGIAAGSEITEWQQGHPLLTYIDVASVRLNRFSPLGLPAWGESIITTSKGAALIAGERGENRYVIAGFDLFPYRGRASPMASVFFLNMLRWLSDASIGGALRQTNQQIAIPATVSNVQLIADKVSSISIADRAERSSFLPESPGIYIPQSAAGPMAASAVNFFSANESNLRAITKTITVSPITKVPDKSERQRELSDYLVPLLILIFLIDALRYINRSTRSVAVLSDKLRRLLNARRV